MKYKKLFSMMTSLCLVSTFIFASPVEADALSLGGVISKISSKLSSIKKDTSDKSNSTINEQTQIENSKASELSYFPVTMYRYGTPTNLNGTSYDSSTFNEATEDLEDGVQGIYFNNGGNTTTIDGSTVTNKYWNRWSANYKDTSELRVSATKGLVENELDPVTGKIKFNYPEAGIFDPDNNTAKSVYTNVKMPFRYDSSTGYYEFDSDKENAYFTDGIGASNTTLNYNGNGFYNNNSGGKGNGFYPFNTGDSGSGKYHFGMNMSVNFFMTEDGTITREDGTKEDIVFRFSGDDDVWIFIDGKLVLDIGGIHMATEGSINFASGEITNPRKLSGINSNQTQGTTSQTQDPTNLYEILGVGSLKEFDKSKAHTLQIFYLERGQGYSNCEIKFNLPLKDTLEVSKKFDESISGLTQEEIQKVKSEVFDFTITKDGEALSNTGYQLYENNTEIDVDKALETDENGNFTLKAGQTIRFYNPSIGNYIVTENENDYTKTWTVGQAGGSTQTGTNNASPNLNINTSNKGYTYTFTCENVLQPILKDDAVVLDFGKPIDINVTANDYLRGGTLDSVSMVSGSGITNYGTISKNNNGTVRYILNKFMNGIDKATYSVKYNDNNSSKTGNITMIPATSVYYEDDFTNSNGVDGIQYSLNWNKIVANNGPQDDGTIGDDYPYGYDSSYSENTTDSNGSVHYIEATTNSETATFTFKGTGCEIYSRTSNETGRVRVQVYKGTELKLADRLTNVVIDTLYKEEGKVLYNIPIFNKTDLEYGEYTVVLTAIKGTNAIPRNIFYLDGVRIYNPTQSAEANNAYQKDNEADAKVVELRDKLIADGVDSQDKIINGIVFIDTNGGESTSDITKYTNGGPKNEIYLKQYQKITFKLNSLPSTAKVQIGAKSPEGEELSLDINNNEEDLSLKSTVDMYYDITSLVNSDGSITITNNSNGMLSLTKLKITGISNEYEIFNSFKLEDYSIIESN